MAARLQQQQQQQQRGWLEKQQLLLVGLAMSVGMAIFHFIWFVPISYPNNYSHYQRPYWSVMVDGEESPPQPPDNNNNNNNNIILPSLTTTTNDKTKKNIDDENNDDDDDDDSYTHSDYYQYKCPIGFTNTTLPLLHRSNRSDEARALSIQENVLPYIHSILDQEMLAGRKIVFVGDSLLRQLTESLACLAGSQRWHTNNNNNNNTLQYPSIPECNKQIFCNQMHYQKKRQPTEAAAAATTTTTVMPPTPALEVYHNVHAGRLLQINPSLNSSWDLQQSWTDAACHTTDHEGDESVSSLLYFHDGRQRITLGPKDFVFLDGTHHAARGQNLKRIVDFAQCLGTQQLQQERQDQRKEQPLQEPRRQTTQQQQQQHYPQFAFLQYSPCHWDSLTGGYPGMAQAHDKVCRSEAHPLQLLYFEKELALFTPSTTTTTHTKKKNSKKVADLLPVVGQVTSRRALQLGRLHVKRGDCMHWLRPGIPDLYLKEIFEWIVEQSQK
jgi:hypothetical protein